MADMRKMEERICEEIDKIAEKGLSTSNLETAYKLIDMYKDLKTVSAMEDASYSDTMAYENYPVSMAMNNRSSGGRNGYEEDGSSYRGRRRDSMGRYSRTNDGGMMRGGNYDNYSQAKQNYRYSRNADNKQAIMDSLSDKMMELRDELKHMSMDSDIPEERQMIDKYIDMIDKLNK